MSIPEPLTPEPAAGLPDAAVVTKRAVSPTGRRRLRQEAAALRRAAHPDVVRFLAFHDLDEGSELRTERAGEHTLLDLAPADGATALALAATLTAAVADIHEIGLVHGRLTPDHVVVRADGRPALCGFAEAGSSSPDVDVIALATLYELLATATRRSGSRRGDRAAARLIATADHARRASPTPSARDLARHLSTPSSTIASLRLPDLRRLRLTPRKRMALVGAAATVAVALVAAMAIRSFGNAPDNHPVLTATPTTNAIAATTQPPTTTVMTPTTATPERRVVRPTLFDAGGARYSVGEDGDLVVVGDWDCDGTPGAALLQPADGDVYVFDRLAAAESPVTGRLVATIAGATDLESIEQAGGCSSLAVRHADGSPQLVAVGAP